MSTNGSTAMDFSEIVGAVGEAADLPVAVCSVMGCFESQNLYANSAVTARAASPAASATHLLPALGRITRALTVEVPECIPGAIPGAGCSVSRIASINLAYTALLSPP